MREYDAIVPGSADRILSAFEREESHRQGLETKIVDANISGQKIGVILGAVIALVTIGGGFWLAYLGKQFVGLAALITALVALVAVFVVGKVLQGHEPQPSPEDLLPVSTDNGSDAPSDN